MTEVILKPYSSSNSSRTVIVWIGSQENNPNLAWSRSAEKRHSQNRSLGLCCVGRSLTKLLEKGMQLFFRVCMKPARGKHKYLTGMQRNQPEDERSRQRDKLKSCTSLTADSSSSSDRHPDTAQLLKPLSEGLGLVYRNTQRLSTRKKLKTLFILTELSPLLKRKQQPTTQKSQKLTEQSAPSLQSLLQ